MPRPHLLEDVAVQDAIISAVSLGDTDEQAAVSNGVSLRTIRRFEKRPEFADFAARMSAARSLRWPGRAPPVGQSHPLEVGVDVVAVAPRGDQTVVLTADIVSPPDVIEAAQEGIPSGRLNGPAFPPLNTTTVVALLQRIVEGKGYPGSMRTFALQALTRVYVEPVVRAQESRDQYAAAAIPTTAREREPGLSEEVARQVSEVIMGPQPADA